jgi:hypothetical protein
MEAALDNLKNEIKALQEENLQLREHVRYLQLNSKSYVDPISVPDDVLELAFQHMQNHKWVDASLVIAEKYGINFMIKNDESFITLRDKMYSHMKIPLAPNRFDKSNEANEARERRKAIKATVYTYIDRMGDYYMKHLEAKKVKGN